MVDTGRRKDKLYFKYKSLPRWDKEGKLYYVKKPCIEVIFRKYSESKDEQNREIRLNALIDSGADWSFLPLEIAETLRLDIDKGEHKILTVGGEQSVFSSKVHLEIPIKGSSPLIVGTINVDIMPHEIGKKMAQFVILGRKDFFEKFEITINESAQYVILKDVHSERLKKTRF